MTTPHDPGGDGRGPASPPPGPYGGYGPGPYGGLQGPPPQGPPSQGTGPYPGSGYHAQPGPGPYGAPPSAYGVPPSPYGSGSPAYNPYGSPYPAGTGQDDADPVPRPGIMVLALVLLVLSALPFLTFGVVFLIVPISPDSIPAEVLENPQLVELDVTAELVIQVLRLIGVILLVLSLLHVIVSVLAFTGRNWARILLTVLTTGFTLGLLAVLAGGLGGDAGSLVFLLLVIGASVGGVVILYLPGARRYFSRPRRRPSGL